MSKHKFICFNCRMSVKRETYPETEVKCPSCGLLCKWIGVKVPVPPKKNIKEWDKLKNSLKNSEINSVEEKNVKLVKRKHALEKEIEKLETRPESTGLLSLIKKLRKELDEINV